MKRFLPILFVTLALAQQAAATNVGGVISGTTTWTKANSPYIVTGATLVDDGATLYIEPGVEVRVDPNVDFFVDGSLRAMGSATDPIFFKSNISNPNRTSWRGINIRSSGAADSVIFNYCHFTSGDRPVFANPADALVIDYCKFTECFAAIRAMSKGGYYIGNSVIKHCQSGILAWAGGVVINNEIAHVYTGIEASGGYIANNFIHDATIQGILLSSYGNTYNEVANNTVVNCDKGFVLHGASSNGVHHNLSVYNNGGYVVENFTGNITNNTALHNNTGLYITSAQVVFKNNCIDSCTQYLVKAEGLV